MIPITTFHVVTRECPICGWLQYHSLRGRRDQYGYETIDSRLYKPLHWCPYDGGYRSMPAHISEGE